MVWERNGLTMKAEKRKISSGLSSPRTYPVTCPEGELSGWRVKVQ